jgi:protein phosphatase
LPAIPASVYLADPAPFLSSTSTPASPSVPLRLQLLGLSDTGRVRRRNEDSLALDPGLGMAIVADGMGGHPGGDVASRTACGYAAERLRALLSAPLPESTTPPLGRAMSEAVLGAHEAVRARSAQEPGLTGMGTTLTALVADVTTGDWVIGHVGDSRAYLLRHGSFRQLTRDDTWVQERVDAEQLTPERARRHPYGHILVQCLGLEDAPVPQVLSGSLREGDVFMLCTDGLTEALEDEILADALRAHVHGAGASTDIEGAARTLVAKALERGAADNVTAVLLAVS